jgi:V-type H+-transporting ATPase subunit a
MFGDVAHGSIVFALGVYLMFRKSPLDNPIIKILWDMRYMISLMGFFAIYCGFIYNDVAGFNMNFFNSCYTPDFAPPHDSKTVIAQGITPSRENCTYAFGIDPVWGRAENELVFVNSLKMKISVIIAFVHMTMGVCIKAANTLYFRKPIDFYFEFIPQLVFMVVLFGYMDFLIIFKWLQPWDSSPERAVPPEQWAPSIIETMMNIGLAMGKTVPHPNSVNQTRRNQQHVGNTRQLLARHHSVLYTGSRNDMCAHYADPQTLHPRTGQETSPPIQ